MPPVVSVITPLFNSAAFLSVYFESILSQTLKDIEIIVVDDCSTDNSLEIAQKYSEQDKRLNVIRLKKNSGASAARNAAIKVATGRFIAFLDSDDLWYPDKLEKQIAFMLKNDHAFTYTAYNKIDEEGKPFQVMGVPSKVSYHDLLKTCVIGCLTAVYDTQKLGKIYMPTNTKREDFATWLNILKKVDYAFGMPEVLAQYRVYENQSSSKKISMAKENWRLYRDVEKLNIFKASYFFFHYAIRGILRNKYPRIAKLIGVLN